MDSKNLEALAALATAAPPGETVPSKASNGDNGEKEADTKLAVPNSPSGSSLSDSPSRTASASITTQPTGGARNANNNSGSWLPEPSSPALSAANLALLSSLQQQVPQKQPDTSGLLSMQQQMNYINYLMQSSQQKMPTVPPSGLSGFPNSNQALQLLLSGNSSNPLLHSTTGTCLIVGAPCSLWRGQAVGDCHGSLCFSWWAGPAGYC